MNMTSYVDRVTTGVDNVARKSLERETRLSHITALWVVLLIGCVLIIMGELTGGLIWLHQVPFSTGLIMIGTFLFLFALPVGLLTYFCRSLLRLIRDLEKRVKALEHAPHQAQEPSATAP